MNKNKILVIVGGPKKKIEAFRGVKTASFSEINYDSNGKELVVRVGEEDVKGFDVIYIRMIGKRLEDATLLASYAKKHKVRLVDRVYENAHLMPSTISKAVETAKLLSAGIPMPKTFYGSLRAGLINYPYVIKSTSGRKAREAWIVSDKEREEKLLHELKVKEKEGMRFFVQEFIPATQRVRAFVLGDKVLGAITRPTKWRKLVDKDYEGVKEKYKISKKEEEIALRAARAVDLEIAGVDIVFDKEGRAYILEVNAAPSWKALAKDTGINVEDAIIKYICK